jgi:streptogramin lyase
MPTLRPSPFDRARRFVLVASCLLAIAHLAGCGSGGSITAPGNPINPTGTLTYSATSFNFATVGIGAKSVQLTLTIQNTGTTTVTFSGVGITGDFTAANNTCTTPLATQTSCSVGLIFIPTAAGARTGTATISSTAATQTIALSGTGGNALSSLSGATLSFGSVALGSSSSTTQSVTLTDAGTAPLGISGFSVTGDFLPISDTCGNLVAINTPCTISIQFTPSALGTRTGSITIASDAPGSPQIVTLTGTGVAPATYPGSAFSLKVQAGTQPISGATTQLYAAGSNGSGSVSTAIVSGLLTNSSGIVTFPANYTCPFAGSLLYAVSTGGTVGSAVASNANAKLLAALGPCNAISSNSQYTVSEATTVAAAYSLAQFYSAGSIGASVTNLTGLTNAFATAAALADPITGAVPGSTMPANATAPTTRVNAVSNLLNACLVTATNCAALYTATTRTTAPANTLDAAFNLVHQPAANVATLFTQSRLSTAYSPALTAAPTDWTLFVTYNGAGLNSPSGLGVDSKGNVWVANYFYVASKFTPQGAPVFASGITGYGLNNSYGLAIDLSDDAWIPNEQPYQSPGTIGSVTELSSTGTAISGASGYTGGGLDYPLSVAIDPNGTVWVVDYGNSYLSILNTTGTPLFGTIGFSTPLFAFPVVVVVDANHYAWTGNQSSNSVTKISPDGSAYTNYITGEGTSGIAIDQSNNVWTANYYDNNVSYLSNSGTLNGNYTGLGSITRPQGIAVDGAGNIWVANYRAPYINELAGSNAATPGAALSPAAGLGTDAGLLEAYAIAIDASGNLWISNQGNNTITRFIGLATPVRTPLSGIPKLP